MSKINQLPFVSVCTPTFNRRPFIPYMIKCFDNQDYPKDRIEWIIVDDGTDKIGDLVTHIPQVNYFAYERKMILGEKRNITNSKAKGDIIIYMDDDDYYPPNRISHAVETLVRNPKAMCAGSSIVFIYFKSLDTIYQFGPYGPRHSTAATFAFRRILLKTQKFDDNVAVSEERDFLNNYNIPFVQLDPFKSILVFAHDHNSVNKEMLLENAHPNYIRPTTLNVSNFIYDEDIKDFYMNRLPECLKTYDIGRPESKPEVLKQIEELKRVREMQIKEMQMKESMENGITLKIGDEPPRTISKQEIVQILQHQHEYISQLTNLLKGKDLEIELLSEALASSRNAQK
jgi:glycosyltransferase involved in cell wall biosynthesis